MCIAKRCGDGYRRDNEACDGADIPDGANCNKLGFYESGIPTCNDACSFDVDPTTTVCRGYCGDGAITPGIEVCESGTEVVSDCVAFGFGAGALECVDCRADTRTCIPFGWRADAIVGLPTAVHGTAVDDVWVLASDVPARNYLNHFDGTAWSQVDLSMCGLQPSSEELNTLWTPAKGIVFAAGAGTLIRLTGGTCTKTSIPDVFSISALWASGANDAWVTTEDAVWQWNGSLWTKRLDATTGADQGTPAAIWGSGPSDVWVSIDDTAGHHLTHYTGSAWTTPIDPGLTDPGTLWGTSATYVYAADRVTNEIARFNGASWSRVATLPPVAGSFQGILRGVTTADGRIFVAGSGFIFAYDGSGWTNLSAPAGSAPVVWAAAGGNAFTINTLSGWAYVFTGSGRFDAPTPTGFAASELVASASDNAYAVLNFYQVTHWDGATWTLDPGINVLGLMSLAMSPSGTAMAVTASANPPTANGLYVRQPNGSWAQMTNGAGVRVWALADNDVWILRTGAVVHWVSSTDATPITFDGTVVGEDIVAASSTEIYVAGRRNQSGVILHYNGAAWAEQTLPAGTGLVRKVWRASASDLSAIAEPGVVLHSSGNGTWTELALPAGERAYDVWGAAGDLFVATTAGLLRHDGLHWDPVSLGAPTYTTLVTGAGDVVQALDASGFHEVIRLAPW